MADTQSTAISSVEYRDIPDHPAYRVGSDGSVWSCWNKVMLGRPHGCRYEMGSVWRRLAVRLDHRGYPCVSMKLSGKHVIRKVHRLVALAFIGPCPEGCEVRHFPDRDKTNNTVANLCYGTKKENAADREAHGTTLRGERNSQSKLTADQVWAIRREYATGKTTLKQLAAEYGVSFPLIGHIVRRTAWKHIP